MGRAERIAPALSFQPNEWSTKLNVITSRGRAKAVLKSIMAPRHKEEKRKTIIKNKRSHFISLINTLYQCEIKLYPW